MEFVELYPVIKIFTTVQPLKVSDIRLKERLDIINQSSDLQLASRSFWGNIYGMAYATKCLMLRADVLLAS